MQQIDNVNHAQRFAGVIRDQYSRVLVAVEARHNLCRIITEIDMFDVVARGHDAVNVALTHAQYAGNHHPLLPVKQHAVITVSNQ